MSTVERLAAALEVMRPEIEKAESVGWRYHAIHDDAMCARDERGCGCLCHTAAAILAADPSLFDEARQQGAREERKRLRGLVAAMLSHTGGWYVRGVSEGNDAIESVLALLAEPPAAEGFET